MPVDIDSISEEEVRAAAVAWLTMRRVWGHCTMRYNCEGCQYKPLCDRKIDSMGKRWLDILVNWPNADIVARFAACDEREEEEDVGA